MGGPDGKYLGIQRWRFYIKCTGCSRPITFLTDPKNADYEMESGAHRNYEVYKDKASKEEDHANEKEGLEKVDPMKALENRVLDSQREMADQDNLEEIKIMNARHMQMMTSVGDDFGADAKSMVNKVRGEEIDAANTAVNGLTADDEALVKSIQFGKRGNNNGGLRRLNDEDERKWEEKRKRETAAIEERQRNMLRESQVKAKATKIPLFKVKRKRNIQQDEKNTIIKKAKSSSETLENAKTKTAIEAADCVDSSVSGGDNTSGGLAGLLGGYGSSSDSD